VLERSKQELSVSRQTDKADLVAVIVAIETCIEQLTQEIDAERRLAAYYVSWISRLLSLRCEQAVDTREQVLRKNRERQNNRINIRATLRHVRQESMKLKDKICSHS
jgi:hypothetical protein